MNVFMTPSNGVQLYGFHGICYSRKYLHLKWSISGTSSGIASVSVSYMRSLDSKDITANKELDRVTMYQREYFGKIRPGKKMKYVKIDLIASGKTLSTTTLKL